MPYEFIDGRWHDPTSPASPTPCTSCGHSGAALLPHRDTGLAVCSVCDPSPFPPPPDDRIDEVFDAREQLPPSIIPTDIAGWVRNLAKYLAHTRPTHLRVSHNSPSTDVLTVVLAAERRDVCSSELVLRAAALAGYPVLVGPGCTHVGISAEPEIRLPGVRVIEVLPAPAGWAQAHVA